MTDESRDESNGKQGSDESEFLDDPFVVACRKLAPEEIRTSSAKKERIFQAYREIRSAKQLETDSTSRQSVSESKRRAKSLWRGPWLQMPVAALAGFLLATLIIPLQRKPIEIDNSTHGRGKTRQYVPNVQPEGTPVTSSSEERELSEIARLVTEGRLDEAETKLQAFRKKFNRR